MRSNVIVAVSLAILTAGSALACDPQLDIASAALTSRGVWRGIELGPGTYANADAAFALCGPRAAEAGPNGLELSIQAAVPVSDDGADFAAASLRYLRFFGEQNASWFGAGYTQYHWGDTAEEWSGEVFAEVRKKVNIESQGFTFWTYAEVAHDFQQWDATFARTGVQHIAGSNRLRLAATIDASVSASDYVDSFGFHAAEASAWLDWTVRPAGTLELGAGGGYVWADNALGNDGSWIGVRVRMR